MAEILIIDDDQDFCEMLDTFLTAKGHEIRCAFTLKEGIREASAGGCDLVFLDVYLPDGNGLDLLPRLREVPSQPEVIIFTGKGSPDGAQLAIESGAWDYIEKPPTLEQIFLTLMRALQYREEKLKHRPWVDLKRDEIVGSSPQIEACLRQVAKMAENDTNVLITGETGTGKELFARAIHQNSPREKARFVVVDCAALPASLVESILFGHVKGAYTGADAAREGLVGQADGGTLFLDEIGELPLSVQTRFLRVIQEHRFRPVGAKKEQEAGFRLVAATNRNLTEMTRRDAFRSDLLFRVRGQEIHLPPLRERRHDIPELAARHLKEIFRNRALEPKGMAPEFYESLLAYGWPGNVRELFNALDEAVSNAGREPVLFPYHLPRSIRADLARQSVERSREERAASEPPALEAGALPPLRDFRNRMERHYLSRLMAAVEGNRSEACRISGLSKSRLSELLKKHRIQG